MDNTAFYSFDLLFAIFLDHLEYVIEVFDRIGNKDYMKTVIFPRLENLTYSDNAGIKVIKDGFQFFFF